jgi:hypothetical protein
MRGNISRVSVVATLAVAVVALSVSPALGHGENDARPLTRGATVGPYVISVWQVIGDHGSDLPSHMIVTFDGASPEAHDAVTITTGPTGTELAGRRLETGSWETAGTVAFGDSFTVAIVTADGAWVSASMIAPEPPSSRLPMRPLMSLTVFLTTAMLLWLGRRTKRVWTSTPVRRTHPST